MAITVMIVRDAPLGDAVAASSMLNISKPVGAVDSMARGIAIALIGISLQLVAINYGVSPLGPSPAGNLVAVGGLILVIAGAALEFRFWER